MKVLGIESVEETVALPELTLSILRPRDSEALLDEEAFEHEEYLPYWAELWPSALALSRVVAKRRLEGARVVELGCGLGVPSIVAALGGARVLATDWSPDALVFTALNADRNGAAVETLLCAWSEAERLVARGPWDLVLASDVLYERRNVEIMLELLPRLVDDTGEILLTDPGRPAAAAFADAVGAEWSVATSADRISARVTAYRLRMRPE